MHTRRPLPAPSPQALQHSNQLTTLIKQRIDQSGGSISFREFMQIALYQPGFGYYVAGAEKFGEYGDFVTAPEISPLFSYCIANHCTNIFTMTDNPQIMELGAGTGIMASDILQKLAEKQRLPEQYLILEPSPELQARQQATLTKHCPQFLDRITWLQALPTQPIQGVILANEVLDAMPVELFSINHETIHSMHATHHNGKLQLNAVATAQQQADHIRQACLQCWDQYHSGHRPQQAFISEYNPALRGWINGLEKVLERGEILLIDYGYERSDYYRPERNQGTLLCHYRHHVHDQPLLWPGLQDITASVDFSAVAEAADQAGLQVAAYTTQAEFLIQSGLEDLFNHALQTQPEQQYQLAQQVRMLTLPAEMGERFKTISLTKGFTSAGQTHTLSGVKNNERRHYL